MWGFFKKRLISLDILLVMIIYPFFKGPNFLAIFYKEFHFMMNAWNKCTRWTPEKCSKISSIDMPYILRIDYIIIRVRAMQNQILKCTCTWFNSIQFFIHSRPVHWYLRFKISIYRYTQNNNQGPHMYSKSNKDKKVKFTIQ